MIRKFDNFLIGLLWLLSVTLATTFWMNINYGFNVLSTAHWAYLSELQASRTQVKFDFYISLIVALAVGIVGLYILIRPRFRKIPTLHAPLSMPPTQSPEQQATTPIISSGVPQPAPQPVTPARPMPPAAMMSRQITPPPTATATRIFTPPTPKVAPPALEIQNNNSEIKNIFESLGYAIKPTKKIGKVVNPVVTLGYDSTVWIVSSDVSVDDMRDAIQTIISIFDDTLGDTANDLTVRGCIINTSEQSDNTDLITTFHDLDEFRKFMNDIPNTKPDDFDSDLFDAISTYISTVTNYIGKE